MTDIPTPALSEERLREIAKHLRDGIEQHHRWADTRFTNALDVIGEMILAQRTTSPALREAAKERAEVIRECCEAINKYIKPGPLQGNGCDETAQRNGMILASNLLMEMLVGARADGEKP